MSDDASPAAPDEPRHAPPPSTDAPPPPQPATPRRPALLTRRAAVVAALLLILFAGAALRFTGLDWDGENHLHPDERFLTIVANKIAFESNPLTYLRTSESRLNPYNAGEGFFVYGNFPLTITRFAAEQAQALCLAISGPIPTPDFPCQHNWTAYNGIHLVGRALSGLVDLLAILFIFLIGRRLYNEYAGLLAALFHALAVLPIQQSHFFTMDNWAAFLTTVTLYTAVRAAAIGDDHPPRSQKRWWVLFGLGLGLTVASRINVAPLAIMVVIAALVWLARRRAATPGQSWRDAFNEHGFYLQVMLVLAALVSILTFRLAQPYAFADGHMMLANLGLRTADTSPATAVPVGPGDVFAAATGLLVDRMDAAAAEGSSLPAIRGVADWLATIVLNPQWRGNMAEIQQLQGPEATLPFTLQWTDRPPIIFPWTNMVLYGMGLFAGLLAWAGFGWALWQLARGRPTWAAHALPVIWVGFYFLFSATRWVKSIRYFLPIYPFLFLLGGWALVALWRRARQREANLINWRRAAVAALALLAILSSALWANAFVDIYRQPVTRVAASEWIFDNVPSGATLVYGDGTAVRDLHLPLKGYEFANATTAASLTVDESGGVRRLIYSIPVQRGQSIEGIDLRYPQQGDVEVLPAYTIHRDAQLARSDLLLAETVPVILAVDTLGRANAMTVATPPAEADGRLLITVDITGEQPVSFDTPPSSIAVTLRDGADQVTAAYPLLGEEAGARSRIFNFQTAQSPQLRLDFTMPAAGTLGGLRFNYLRDPEAGTDGEVADDESLRVRLQDTLTGETLAEGVLRLSLDGERRPATLSLPAVPLQAGGRYTFLVDVGPGGPVSAGTSILINEHWDDPLPVRFEGKDGFFQYYSGVAEGVIPITGLDSAEKRLDFYRWLDEADYIILSSQRALWSLPRIPLSYPLTIRYYEGLFNGDLGFELASQHHADLHIGPLYISDTGAELGWGAPPEIGWPPPGDLAAEEAFSVYDHPPVWIFVKQPDYSSERVAAVLGAVDLANVVFMTPGDATAAPNGLLLSATAARLQQANGTFNNLYAVDGPLNNSPALAAIVWWLAVICLGWLAFPLSFVVFRGLPDRGYALARILALLLVSYFGWLMGSLNWLPHSRGTLLLGTFLLAATAVFITWFRKEQLAAFIRRQWKLLLFVELLGVALFALQIGIRLGNPDVWDVIWGGEKPMDLSYFNAVLKSTVFPPYDPWFAGGYINYYYYGFVYVGAITILLGIVPALAYNLILPMLFAFTGLGAFSIAYNLVAWRARSQAGDVPGRVEDRFLRPTRRGAIVAGLVAMTLCLLLGNLAEIGVMFSAWERSSDSTIDTGIAALDTAVRTVDGAIDLLVTARPAPIYTGDWFFSATRTLNANEGEVIPITEFPFFTFLYADLHAHMIALPLTLLALGWAVSLVLAARRTAAPLSLGNRAAWLARWFVGAVAIGVLQATNTWDWPTYLFLGCLAVVYVAWRSHGRLSQPMAGQALLQAGALIALATLAFLPFSAHYGSGYTSLSLWEGSYTRFGAYLRVYGLFLFLALTYLAREFRAWTREWTAESLAGWRPYALPVVSGALFFALLNILLWQRGYHIAPFILAVVVLAGVIGLRPGLPANRRVVLILLSSALGLTLFVEIFVLEGDIGRMNTVFKFYMQSWVMLSIVGGAAFASAWPAIRRWSPPSRNAWQGALAILVFLAALYPVLATRAKWAVRMNADAPNTLDGMAFMPYVNYGDSDHLNQPTTVSLATDYEAIQWLQRNVEGSPIIVEAHSDNPYRSVGNRVSMYTGLPAVIGWDWHQRQQRAVVPETLVRNRINDVNNLYRTTDIGEARAILEKYDIRYIYVGQLEWVYYPPEGLLKFDEMASMGWLREVYRNSGASIYEVLLPGTAQLGGGLP